MSRALLTTRLKVVDPAAVTALETLRHRLGIGERLGALSREEVFLFEVEGPRQAVRGQIEGLVRGTNLLMNPNKHVCRLLVEGDEGAPSAPAADGGAHLLVWTPGDGADLLASIRRHALAPGVVGLARGWLWCFTPGARVDAGGMRAIVEQAGELQSRSRGFLVHPAYQDHRVYDRRPTLYDVGAVVPIEPTSGSSREKS